MAQGESAKCVPSVIDRRGLQSLLDALLAEQYEVIAPKITDGAVGLASVRRIEELPLAWRDEQGAGRYRLEASPASELLDHGAPVHSWKRFLYPTSELLLRTHRVGNSIRFEPQEEAPKRLAFLGIRGCDLAALNVLDRVLAGDRGADTHYASRRKDVLVIAADCVRACGTGFCASMGTGPGVDDGYDLKLTELATDDESNLLIQAGTETGGRFLSGIARRPAESGELEGAREAIANTAAGLSRSMIPDVAALLSRNLEHRAWNRIADRCLSCGNCTLVCPTCFCATVEDTTDLSGTVAERWRRADSCFTSDFSYIHGGSIRRGTASRYRQWMTHKLSSWWEQFGVSGCVGCGRCVTWCPVGIDITAEARSIQESEGVKQS
ncbi:MAG: sulfite reductase subunit A [Rhodospirillales bacterium]|nr:sulfite reductase subunit A [Rhodospirillales bacterium]